MQRQTETPATLAHTINSATAQGFFPASDIESKEIVEIGENKEHVKILFVGLTTVEKSRHVPTSTTNVTLTQHHSPFVASRLLLAAGGVLFFWLCF